jgi:hypothetical protein
MSEDTDVIVGSLGRGLVSDLAPEELPLYPSLLSKTPMRSGPKFRKYCRFRCAPLLINMHPQYALR